MKGAWEVKGGGEGRREMEKGMERRGREGERRGGRRGREGEGEEKGERRGMETGWEKRTSKGRDSKHNITPVDTSATYPWDIAHINIHPPFQSGPLILVGWCSLSSSPYPPNNIGQEQITTCKHLNEDNIPSPEQQCLWPCQEQSFVATTMGLVPRMLCHERDMSYGVTSAA